MNRQAFIGAYPLFFLDNMDDMRKTLILLFLFVSVCLFARQHVTVIISLDGYRWDYPLMYDTKVDRKSVV